MPLSTRVVEVIADRGGGPGNRYSYGSGCIVAGSTVLTSAHVVASADSVRVRGVDKREYKASLDTQCVGDPGGWRADGSASPDLALVTIDVSEGVESAAAGVGTDRP